MLEEVAAEMATELRRKEIEVDRIAGVVLGSVPLAVALSLRTGIPFIMVRKEKKDHGTGKLIEGCLPEGDESTGGRGRGHLGWFGALRP